MSSTNRPLDLGKLDFEKNRRLRRTRLLLWSLPLVLGMLVVVGWLILPFVATAQASTLNQQGKYDSAAVWLGLLGTNTLFEPYKRPFNQAIVATEQKKFMQADQYFRQAIALAPADQRCFVRVQSVLSSERAGDDAAGRRDFQTAITSYTKALADINANKACFSQYPELAHRIAEKLATVINTVKEKTYQDPNKTPESSKQDSEQPSEEQLKKMRELQQQGQIRKQENQQTPTDATTVDHPW